MKFSPLKATAETQAMLAQAFVHGSIPGPKGPVPSLSTRIRARDVWGGLRVRLGMGRSSYRVISGLYAVGLPQDSSPVLVTANYKLSLDALRKEGSGIDAWILVLDTRGVNVWCSAGKGSFGNKELARSIAASHLGLVVTGRDLILPQLSATGISAPVFLKENGWRIRFGPVRARDIPAYLAAGGKKTQEMRRMDFPLAERLILGPIEFIVALKKLLPALGLFLIVGLARALITTTVSPVQGLLEGGRAFLPWLLGIFGGTILVPVFLPILPSRAFTIKGSILGLGLAIFLGLASRYGILDGLAAGLVITAICAWYALNFTGSTTFTSLSGVALEVKWARLPIFIAGCLGLGLQTLLLALGQ